MKKTLYIVLTALLFVGLFVSCADSPEACFIGKVTMEDVTGITDGTYYFKNDNAPTKIKWNAASEYLRLYNDEACSEASAYFIYFECGDKLSVQLYTLGASVNSIGVYDFDEEDFSELVECDREHNYLSIVKGEYVFTNEGKPTASVKIELIDDACFIATVRAQRQQPIKAHLN